MTRLGKMIRAARTEHNWSLREFAEQVGLTAMFISQIERGQRVPRKPEHLQAIADVLGVEIAEIGAAAGEARIDRELDKGDTTAVSTAKIALARSIASSDLDEARVEKIMKVLRGEL